MPLTLEHVREHVGTHGKVEWVRAGDLLQEAEEYCVDGRGAQGIVGTPGGNAGEFLLALGAYEKVSGQSLDVQDIPKIFDAYCTEFGRFYMHTDTHALHKMPKALLESVGDGASGEALHDYLVNPPNRMQDELLQALANPDFMGCGHLKLTMNNPENYGVRRELAEAFVKTYYQRLWAGADLDYVVLEGDHQEGAVTNVTVATDPINADTRIPTISPTVAGRQMFVNHPQAAAFLRSETANNIQRVIQQGNIDTAAFVKAMGDLAQQQLGHTLSALAKGLPIYEVRFSDENNFEVTALGNV